MKRIYAYLTKYFEQIFWYFKVFRNVFKSLFDRVLIVILLCLLFFSSSLFCQNAIKDKEVSFILKEIKHLQVFDENKALNLLNETLVYEQKLPDSLLVKLYDIAGSLYASQETYDYALNYYNSELLLQKKINSEDRFITLKNIGNIYYNLGKDDVAKKYWSEALEGYKKKRFPKIYALYNNLAILEEKAGNYQGAKRIYTDALNQSIKLSDDKGKFNAYQNLGIVSFKLSEFESALDYSFKAKHIAAQFKGQNDMAKILYNLGYLYYNLPAKNKDSAEYYLNKSFLLSKNFKYPSIQKASSETLIKLYEDERRYELANFYLHQAKIIRDDELDKMTNKQIGKIEFRYKQKLKEEIDISQHKRKNLIYFIFLLILVASCIILFLIYKLQKIKLTKTRLENALLLERLEERNKEITQKSLEVLHVNGILDVAKRKLTDLKGKSELKIQIVSILNEIKSSQKGLNFEEFEKILKETHKDFYRKLIELYPDLSRTDLKLSAFLRLNLSTKDISALTGQSQNSINIARHRLRKKLKLQDHENMINFLIGITN